jgi:hypothetical protein
MQTDRSGNGQARRGRLGCESGFGETMHQIAPQLAGRGLLVLSLRRVPRRAGFDIHENLAGWRPDRPGRGNIAHMGARAADEAEQKGCESEAARRNWNSHGT